jgi:hypothetical protein
MAELSSKLQFGKSLREYYPSISREWLTPKEAQKEYNRLRAIANKRYEALERNYPASSMAQEYRGGFPSAKGETDDRVYNRLYNVAKYLESKLSSVTGQRSYRKKAIASLHESGYDFINESNFDQFTAYMDEVKSHSDARSIEYQSEDIVEMFGRVMEEDADPEEIARDFEYWLDNEDAPMPKSEKRRPKTEKEREKIRQKQADMGAHKTAGRRGQSRMDRQQRARNARMRNRNNRNDRRRGRRR